LLVDGIEGILDRDAFQVPRGHFKTKWEVEIDLLDRGVYEQLLEDFLVVYCCR